MFRRCVGRAKDIMGRLLVMGENGISRLGPPAGQKRVVEIARSFIQRGYLVELRRRYGRGHAVAER